MGIRVAVAGASGYAGGELLRLIAGHPELDLVAATGHSQVGTPLAAVHPQLAGLDITLGATDATTLGEADLVFLALPHGQSAALAAALPAAGKGVDLGAVVRLRAGAAWAR
jgi:N-acetyl-gamma-glutamyl-phosphate reductase